MIHRWILTHQIGDSLGCPGSSWRVGISQASDYKLLTIVAWYIPDAIETAVPLKLQSFTATVSPALTRIIPSKLTGIVGQPGATG